ncbi:MAG: hypothetical protein AAF959_22330, partial [Cyanobacteria bacterium P01_D01_bin.56]
MKQIFIFLVASRVSRWHGLFRVAALFLLGAATVAVISACGARVQTHPSLENASFPTRTVQHALGETVIPEEPQRIVTLVPGAVLDSLLALDAKPVGMVVFTNRTYE